jgi:hypothetical protein
MDCVNGVRENSCFYQDEEKESEKETCFFIFLVLRHTYNALRQWFGERFDK